MTMRIEMTVEEELRHLRAQRDDLQRRDSELISEVRILRRKHPCLACVLLAKIAEIKPRVGGEVIEVHVEGVPLEIGHTCGEDRQ